MGCNHGYGITSTFIIFFLFFILYPKRLEIITSFNISAEIDNKRIRRHSNMQLGRNNAQQMDASFREAWI